MTTDFMALPPEPPPRRYRQIRERGELEAFFYLYVVNDSGKLVGVVPIRNLVIAPPSRTLSEMMIADPVKANVFMDQEESARLVARYEMLALPIVDEGGLEGSSPSMTSSTSSIRKAPRTCTRWSAWPKKTGCSRRWRARSGCVCLGPSSTC
jgi:CBS domain-containing protein